MHGGVWSKRGVGVQPRVRPGVPTEGVCTKEEPGGQDLPPCTPYRAPKSEKKTPALLVRNRQRSQLSEVH